jgi:catechol 2,3-dioxygenase-like lactoylglutathione lyase family enzyme
MVWKLDHVGHIVKNLDEGMKLYKKLGLTPSDSGIIEFAEFGARMAFFPFAGIELELIEPGGRGKDPAARCLKERGEGLFHLSIRTDDYETEVKTLREKGFTVEEYTHSRPGQTSRLAFLAPEETLGLWIEFIDTAGDPP